MPSSHNESFAQHISVSSMTLWNLLLWSAGFRFPMSVTEVMAFETFHGKTGYYVCPRCSTTMEREFVSYCDRCGQHLSWKGYRKAKVVYPGKK